MTMAHADEVKCGLIGHWPLAGNAQDASGHNRPATNHGVTFESGQAAEFSGQGAFLEVPESSLPPIGSGDFSVAAWINLDRAPDDALGDIASLYDPATDRGFHLSVLNFTGVTSAHSNYRTLHFGLSNGETPRWTDAGRPGNSRFICALAVYDGALYAGTFEGGEGEAGHVYRYNGGDDWVDCGSPDASNCVATLAVHGGKLYAGTSRYKAGGSALTESPNLNPGGGVYRYEGGTTWASCGRLGDEADTAWAMTAHDGHLYAIPIYHQGMWRYDGDETWTYCGTPGVRLMAVGVFDGRLYGAGNEGNHETGVYRYEGGTEWSLCGRLPGVDQVYSFVAYNGRFYAGTWPDAVVFRYEGGRAWTPCGRLGQENEVMPMVVYNGKLYAGSLPTAEVYRYDGGEAWTSVGRLDHTPDVRYRRVWSMALFDGKLFCGTLPSGRVHAMESGCNVTYDRALSPGWHHVAAVRQGAQLALYVDGARADVSSASSAQEFEVGNAPLRIGFGTHDYFNGAMRGVRLYGRALNESEVTSLAAK